MSAEPKPQILERILFIMPRDLELLFPAMAVLQSYVNGYAEKMKNPMHDPTRGQAEWKLSYCLQMDGLSWKLFLDMGIELDQQPEIVDASVASAEWDAVFDLSDDRIESWEWAASHAAQVCGYMVGVTARAYPQVRQLVPKKDGEWFQTADFLPGYPKLFERHVVDWFEGVGGIIGTGWVIYAAAAMGLPVIEIVPRGRSRNWLTKMRNPFYRMCASIGELAPQVQRARASIQRSLEIAELRKLPPAEVVNVC
ncbi:MAG: hypothetical protein KGL39_22200 [Patescibacteria group bacterium]|nr:hypothetical protein [Patescibacteria group bacterium]